MSLDLFADDQQAALADATHNIAPDLPAGLGEAFDVSLRHASEWSNSLAYSYARERALASYYDDVKTKTGEQLPLYGLGGNVSLDDVNAAQAKIATAHPDLDLQPLTDDSIDTMTMKRMASAQRDAAALSKRETTWGGTFGGFAGATVGFLSDLPQLALLPLGGAGQLGIAGRALEFAAIGGGSAAVTAGLSYFDRERAVPGSAAKEIPGEIATATLFGGALGGAFGALGKWLGASAKTLPTAVRDDVNAAASEAQLAASNVFDGAAAEIAHRDAVTDAVRAAVNGRPVKSGDAFIEAWHGSPHSFDAFDIGRVGDGEGAQTYGRGIYVAENREVAEFYRGSVLKYHAADGAIARLTPDQEEVAGILRKAGGDVEAAKRDIAGIYAPADRKGALADLEAVKGLAPSEGQLYGVKVKADPDAMLDWNASLDQQPERVRAALDRLGVGDAATGGDAFAALKVQLGNDGASQALQDAGMSGIRYLDSGSRAADAATRTRNFVIFNADDLVITHRNGEAVLTPELAEAKLRPVTFGEKVEAEAFDPMPHAADDAASYWETRLAEASPEERAALGATDAQPVRAPDLAPDQIAKLAEDPQMPDVQMHDLEHIINTTPDLAYTETVRLADGSTEQVTRPLREVLAELGEREQAAKELQACVIGMEAAE